MILGQRLLELDATVLNSNIVSTDDHHGLDEDGNNQFKWSGYAFVWVENAVDTRAATLEWPKAIR